ncbi:MAG: hypothetical protein AAGM16_12325 [Pseudomonadota bacterium]
MADRAGAHHPRAAVLALGLALCLIAPEATAQQAAVALPEPVILHDTEVAYRSGDDKLETRLERAREVVAQAAAAKGLRDNSVASARHNLALLQAEDGNYGPAIENFRAAIATREAVGRSLVAPDLVNSLVGLANALEAAGEEEAAITTLERAIHIAHVNEGPDTLSQVPFIDALSELYEDIGDSRESRRMHDHRYRIVQRSFEAGDDALVDALEYRARWARRVDNDELASLCYTQITQGLAKRFGDKDPRLIDPLMKFATVSLGRETGRYARTEQGLLSEARRAIGRAERIARESGDAEVLARMLVRKGDWMQYVGSSRGASDSYNEAWGLMDGAPALAPLKGELFGQAVAIYEAPMYMIYGNAGEVDNDPRFYPDEGFVTVNFSVDASGKVFDIDVVDSEPTGLRDVYVYRRLGAYVFRPRFVDGMPVAQDGFTFRHDFRYNASRFSSNERKFLQRKKAERDAKIAAQPTATNGEASGG